MTDPIADMLTRIRNALTAKHETVEVPASKIKVAIAEILVKEGYVKGFEVVDGAVQNTIVITLKYAPVKGQKVVTGLKRVSTPGLRGCGQSSQGSQRNGYRNPFHFQGYPHR